MGLVQIGGGGGGGPVGPSLVMLSDDVDSASFADQDVPYWDAAQQKFVGQPIPGTELAHVELSGTENINVLGQANRVALVNMPLLNFVMPNRPVQIEFALSSMDHDQAGRLFVAGIVHNADNYVLYTSSIGTILKTVAGNPPTAMTGRKFWIRPGVPIGAKTYNVNDNVSLKMMCYHNAGTAMSTTVFFGFPTASVPSFVDATVK